MSKNKLGCRRMIEALRLGVVPIKQVHRFTFGRNSEISKIREWLKRSSGMLGIFGQYGSGKTHLLNYLRHMGLKLGYAVSIAEVEPIETPLYDPNGVYQRLVSSFTWLSNGQQHDFRDFLQGLASVSKSERIPIRDHLYLSEVVYPLEYLNILNSWSWKKEKLFRWIEGWPKYNNYRRPILYNDSTAANIYCNILSGLGYAAKTIGGLKGLLIILDEGESVDSSRFYNYQRERSMNFLKGSKLLASNDDRLMREYVGHQYILDSVGELTGLIYHRNALHVKYAHSIPSYVKVVIAFTSQEYRNIVGDSIALSPLSDEARRMIVEEIFRKYRGAYRIEARATLPIYRIPLSIEICCTG